MKLRSVRHRGLRRFIETDDPREIRGDLRSRVRNILTVLLSAENMDGVFIKFTGDRAGAWSLSVSGNWRITFELVGGEIANLDLEDYH